MPSIVETPHVSLLGVQYRVMPLPVYWLVISLPRYTLPCTLDRSGELHEARGAVRVGAQSSQKNFSREEISCILRLKSQGRGKPYRRDGGA